MLPDMASKRDLRRWFVLCQHLGLPSRREIFEWRRGFGPVTRIINNHQPPVQLSLRQLPCRQIRLGAEHLGAFHPANAAVCDFIISPPSNPNRILLASEK